MSELQEKIERIEREGISKTGIFIREKILTNIGVPLDRPADVVVVTGCNALLRPLILLQLADILTKLKVNFTFLSFEHCCFGEVVREALYQGDASLPVYEAQARIWNRRNCTKARDLGAHTVVNLCGGCNATYSRQAADVIRSVYYVNFLQELSFTGQLDLHVDVYEGCHRKHNYYPEFHTGEENTIALLGKIRGLTLNRIPGAICCNKVPDQVLKRVTSPTLVVPSSCCFSNLRRTNTDPNLKIISLIEVLAKSLA